MTIDTRGLSCPEPVIAVRKALMGTGKSEKYTVIADNHAAKENITRFAQNQGYNVSVTTNEAGEYILELE